MIASRVTMRGADGEQAPVPITEQVGLETGLEVGLGGGWEGLGGRRDGPGRRDWEGAVRGRELQNC